MAHDPLKSNPPRSALGRLAALAWLTVAFTACAPFNLTGPAAVDQMAQVQDMPQWRLGDRWVYDDGYDLKVSDIQGNITRFDRGDDAGRWMKRFGFLTVASHDGEVERRMLSPAEPATSLFPLEVGKSVIFTKRYTAGDEERLHQQSWLVEGRERITVPAGSFDCWVILFTSRSLKSDWRSFERWWYSPEINQFVRMDYQYADSPVASRKLVSYRPGEVSPTLAEEKGQAVVAPVQQASLDPEGAEELPPPTPPLLHRVVQAVEPAAVVATSEVIPTGPGYVVSERQGSGRIVFWVHVGYFDDPKQQERVVARLRPRLPVQSGKVAQPGGTVVRVQAGPFPSLEKAEAALVRVGELLNQGTPATSVAQAGKDASTL